MSKTVEFYFDFGSPAAYLAWTQLPQIAERTGAAIVWRPMLLGGVFQATDNRSPVSVPAKGRYMWDDLQRFAKHYGVTYRYAINFPVNTITLMRGATALQMAVEAAAQADRAEAQASFERYVAAIYQAMWLEPQDMTDLGNVGRVIAEAGLDAAALAARTQAPEVKERLKADTAAAVARGIFGAPSFFVNDTLYWGQDRLDWVERHLATL
jgi:2-hydroxychromene-2-carboxylate isomerase